MQFETVGGAALFLLILLGFRRHSKRVALFGLAMVGFSICLRRIGRASAADSLASSVPASCGSLCLRIGKAMRAGMVHAPWIARR